MPNFGQDSTEYSDVILVQLLIVRASGLETGIPAGDHWAICQCEKVASSLGMFVGSTLEL